MKLVAEYLERAHQFERMTAHETDPKLKEESQRQARAYHKLAVKRAQQLGIPVPPDTSKGNKDTLNTT